jgi:signal peptidase I
LQLQPGRSADGTPPAFHLNIGGMCIAVAAADPELTLAVDEAMARFLVPGGTPDTLVTAGFRDALEVPPHEPLFDAGSQWKLYRDGASYRFTFSSPVFGPLAYREAVIDPDFTSAEVQLRRDAFDATGAIWPLEFPLDELIVQGLLARGRGVEVHACGVVEPSGLGLLFVGQSGAGKTTMARLWQRVPGTRILSDDRIIVRRRGGRLVMYGTPWHGEAELSEPDSTPLTEVFFLAHGGTNDLVPLGRAEAAARLVACGFPPFYDRRGLDFTVGFFGELVGEVPCRELRFAPDRRVIEFIRTRVRGGMRTRETLEVGVVVPADAAFSEVVRGVLREARCVRFRATGASMNPTIREGEAITVAPVRPGEIRRGDIVLFDARRGVTVHRVVRVRRDPENGLVFLTRGDAAATADEPVGGDALLGRVVAVERRGRTVNLAGARVRIMGAGRTGLVHLLRRLRSRLVRR